MSVSIIIPSYNQEQYLAEAIESAIAQTEGCEVIVVDDGSTDGSLALAKTYEPQIKVVSQVNKGLASARNAGIMNSTEEWILPLDADDFLDPKCVGELCFKAAETGADIIAPSIQEVGISHATIILKENPTLADFRLGNHIGYFSMIRKSALLAVGGYSPKMVEGYEDMHLTINLLTRGYKIATIPQPLAFYRTKPNSMWTEAKKHHQKLMMQIYKDFPQLLPNHA